MLAFEQRDGGAALFQPFRVSARGCVYAGSGVERSYSGGLPPLPG
jgi:hypothetical protein